MAAIVDAAKVLELKTSLQLNFMIVDVGFTATALLLLVSEDLAERNDTVPTVAA
jgi:hypothetical protein